MKNRKAFVITEGIIIALLSGIVAIVIEMETDNSMGRVLYLENNETIKAECIKKNDIIIKSKG